MCLKGHSISISVMKRRQFIKGTALTAAAAALAPALNACKCEDQSKGALAVAANLKYRPDGTFTVLQFTDTHYIAGDSRSVRALECVKEAVEAVKPDLIIHTGDIVFGSPDLESAREILAPISESGVPFAVALGNHDAEFGSTREEIFSCICSIKGCVNLPPKEGVYGCSNDVITLSGASGVDRALYIFDSMREAKIKGEEGRYSYDYIRHSQISWYRNHSEKLAAANGGNPVPALAFFHVPLRELGEGLMAEGHELIGNNYESPCPSRLNSGLLAQFLEMGDVEAVVNGHDHNCDYVLHSGPMFYIYGRYSGCDTVYNDLGREGVSAEKVSGTRIFSFKEGESGFHTWVRLLGGEIQQKIYCHDNSITME